MTRATQEHYQYVTDVPLYRYDRQFGGWDLTANFRLWGEARLAARTLSSVSNHIYKVIDQRVEHDEKPQRWFVGGRECTEDPFITEEA